MYRGLRYSGIFFFKQKTAYEMRMSDWSSNVCSSDLLERWLQGVVPSFTRLASLEKFPGGQSNPTYRVDTAGKSYVLRRKQFGQLLPSAHAVEREFRLMLALQLTVFPTPAPIQLCDDATVIGTKFEHVELCVRLHLRDGKLAGRERET